MRRNYDTNGETEMQNFKTNLPKSDVVLWSPDHSFAKCYGIANMNSYETKEKSVISDPSRNIFKLRKFGRNRYAVEISSSKSSPGYYYYWRSDNIALRDSDSIPSDTLFDENYFNKFKQEFIDSKEFTLISSPKADFNIYVRKSFIEAIEKLSVNKYATMLYCRFKDGHGIGIKLSYLDSAVLKKFSKDLVEKITDRKKKIKESDLNFPAYFSIRKIPSTGSIRIENLHNEEAYRINYIMQSDTPLENCEMFMNIFKRINEFIVVDTGSCVYDLVYLRKDTVIKLIDKITYTDSPYYDESRNFTIYPKAARKNSYQYSIGSATKADITKLFACAKKYSTEEEYNAWRLMILLGSESAISLFPSEDEIDSVMDSI